MFFLKSLCGVLQRARRVIYAVAIALGIGVLLASCANMQRVATSADTTPLPHPIRFLLTFDDGPSSAVYLNSTVSILNELADNPLQPGIKAIFFVQTRAGAEVSPGRELLRREQADGHLVEFHTATRLHLNHRFLSPASLEQSLQDGVGDITREAGVAPTLVRPPFWRYDARTLAAYRAHGMDMLLTDLSANDGEIWGINFSVRKRSNMRNQLADMREQLRADTLPVVNGVVPIVVTFHDLNAYTARHLGEYLQILIEVAQDLHLPTSAKPFYDDRIEIDQAAHARTIHDATQEIRFPGLWNLVWTMWQ